MIASCAMRAFTGGGGRILYSLLLYGRKDMALVKWFGMSKWNRKKRSRYICLDECASECRPDQKEQVACQRAVQDTAKHCCRSMTEKKSKTLHQF